MRGIYVDLKINNEIIRVYCIHLSAVQIKYEDKTQYLKGNNISLNSIDFIWNKLAGAFVFRSYQTDYIKRNIDKCPYSYIIAGDFNDTPNSYAFGELKGDLKDAFREKGSGFVTTYYSKYPLQIDHVLVSPMFDVIAYQSIDKELSDHKPIVADLKLNKSAE